MKRVKGEIVAITPGTGTAGKKDDVVPPLQTAGKTPFMDGPHGWRIVTPIVEAAERFAKRQAQKRQFEGKPIPTVAHRRRRFVSLDRLLDDRDAVMWPDEENPDQRSRLE